VAKYIRPFPMATPEESDRYPLPTRQDLLDQLATNQRDLAKLTAEARHLQAEIRTLQIDTAIIITNLFNDAGYDDTRAAVDSLTGALFINMGRQAPDGR
jgi:hypothetical protein